MIVIVGQNSVWQKTYSLESLKKGSVNRVVEARGSASGKGANVAMVLRALRVPAQLFGYAGGANGDRFIRGCSEQGIDLVCTSIEAETRQCVTLIENDETVTEVVEPAPEVSPAEREIFSRNVLDALESARALVISGTALNGEPSTCYADFVDAARALGVPVVLDAHRAHGRTAVEAGPDILKINEDELSALAGHDCSSPARRHEAAGGLIRAHRIRFVIVTRGKDGAEGYSGTCCVRTTVEPMKIANPIGSGDAFAAAVVQAVVGAESPDWSDELLRQSVTSGVSVATTHSLTWRPGDLDTSLMSGVTDAIRTEITPEP